MLFRIRKQPIPAGSPSLRDKFHAAWLMMKWRLASPEKRRRMKHSRRRPGRAAVAIESLAGKPTLPERLCSLFIARRPRRAATHVVLCHHSLVGLQALERRELLYGYIQANSEGPFYPLNTSTYSVAAPGVLSSVGGSNPPFTAHLGSQAQHGTATVNADGSWWYTANAGCRLFQIDYTLAA